MSDPITREEAFLKAIAEGSEPLEPITRREMFLAKMAGHNTETPTPITREEMFLARAAENAGSGGGGSSEEWIGDGNTHIWITLHEGRTSPMLGVCPNGTVTVDWGDGTTPDTLTGTSISSVKWTPKHEYSKAGNYVITLTVDGEMAIFGTNNKNEGSYILRYNSATYEANSAYLNAIKKVEIGNNVSIRDYALCYCQSLTSVAISDGITSIGKNAFQYCYSLVSVVMPNSLTSIGSSAFDQCYALATVAIPDSVTSIGTYLFNKCYSLSSVVIPSGITSIKDNTFYFCYSLVSVVIPHGITNIGTYAFSGCYSLSSVVIPNSVTSISASAFASCRGIRYFDFTNHTAVPTLADTYAFYSLAPDCEIRVPTALYDEWIAATNWSTSASKIVAV